MGNARRKVKPVSKDNCASFTIQHLINERPFEQRDDNRRTKKATFLISMRSLYFEGNFYTLLKSSL